MNKILFFWLCFLSSCLYGQNEEVIRENDKPTIYMSYKVEGKVPYSEELKKLAEELAALEKESTSLTEKITQTVSELKKQMPISAEKPQAKEEKNVEKKNDEQKKS